MTIQHKAGQPDQSGRGRLTVAICFMVALLEGYDIQAAGVAAPGLSRALGLPSDALGLFFSASTVGMLMGGWLGGWLADRNGRKLVLLFSVAIFGLFSLGTVWSTGFLSLVTMRFFTGLGLGAAFPVLITIAAESNPNSTGKAVALMYAGTPLGGAIAGFSSIVAEQWQTIFLWGGLLPLMILPILWFGLHEPKRMAARHPDPADQQAARHPSFLRGRWVPTLLLWCAFLSALLVFYLMLNWTPMLLAQKGLSKAQTGLFQSLVNIAGAASLILLSPLLTARHYGKMAMGAYVMAIIGLVLTAYIMPSTVQICIAAALLGGGLLTAQSVLYATGPLLYPQEVRATGTGAAFSVGRIGSVTGPVVAGIVLSLGVAPTTLILLIIPILLVAMITNRAVLLWTRDGIKG